MNANIQDLLAHLGFSALNEMQEATVEAISKARNDVIVLSPTGSGKTLAYLIPLIEKIDKDDNHVQAIVIVPNRELARQSLDVMKKMGSPVSAYACYGGRPAMDEHRELRDKCPQLIFSTPGRLNDHLDKQNFDPSHVAWIVIDEFDKCLEFGFHDEMKRAIKHMPTDASHILLSATDIDSIPHFVDLKRAKRLDFLRTDLVVDGRVGHYFLRSPQADKLESLSAMLRTFGQQRTLVFTGYRDSVERIASYLQSQGFLCAALHGGLEQEKRNEALYLFANKSANILISTNLSSRGLDIPEVDNIIHYHLPEGKDDYVHRVGRTARWDAVGRNFFLLGPDEQIPSYVDQDFSPFELPSELPPVALPEMTTLYIGKGKRDKVSKVDVLGLLCKKGGLAASEVGRIDIFERYSRVAINRLRSKDVLRKLAGEKIKGVKTIIEEMKV